ncbi:MAG TPA: hypothetical protein VN362_21940 [Xanthobacteraceae bacterium]|nr:hypothetical protein [Xanthobacteraceae bacterium]
MEQAQETKAQLMTRGVAGAGNSAAPSLESEKIEAPILIPHGDEGRGAWPRASWQNCGNPRWSGWYSWVDSNHRPLDPQLCAPVYAKLLMRLLIVHVRIETLIISSIFVDGT